MAHLCMHRWLQPSFEQLQPASPHTRYRRWYFGKEKKLMHDDDVDQEVRQPDRM